MEIILSVLALLLIQYVLYLEIKKVQSSLEFNQKTQTSMEAYIRKHLESLNDSVVALDAEQRRTLLAFRDTLESTKPIRPNNWDSVKEAFKGPTRATLNERD